MDDVIVSEEIEELDETGSFNHGYVQMRMGAIFDRMGRFTPISELSLDTSGIDLSQFSISAKSEIKPDICLYSKRGLSRPIDTLRMREMPLLVIEILSPRQGIYDILEKFSVYFALGIQSCWLVESAIGTVTAYSSMEQWQTFSQGEVVDGVIDIRLSVDEIFS